MASRLSGIVHQVHSYINFLNQYNALPQRISRRALTLEYQRALAKAILDGGRPQLAGYQFSMVRLRTLAGRHAGAVLAINRRLKLRRRLRVFVGHRFVSRVTDNLRHNLQLVLKPYGIDLWYSDTDMPNDDVFQTILRRIKASDFCVFDDRETEVRPNVLIELGSAIALGRPYFYFNFQNKRTVVVNGKRERITTSSDLAGMLYLAYSTYEDLFREFAIRLPGFFASRNLARTKMP